MPMQSSTTCGGAGAEPEAADAGEDGIVDIVVRMDWIRLAQVTLHVLCLVTPQTQFFFVMVH